MPIFEDLPDSSSALLSHPSRSETQSKSRSAKLLFFSLLVTASVAISAAVVFGFLFYSGASSSVASTFLNSAGFPRHVSRPLKKLNKPVVLVVSTDGFRFGYQHKTPTPNIHRLINDGTEADLGLIPVFPTLTFPNHYSIATGLYPASHGIVNNVFTNPATGEKFSRGTNDTNMPKWWFGEPLWVTAVNNGLKAAAYFWPGSEVKKGKWDCPEEFCPPYDKYVPFEKRVDTILSYFNRSSDEIPSLMMLYLSDPDTQGHKVGPDAPEITEAVSRIDRMVGKLIRGLEELGIFEDVTFILLGDHGMVGTCDQKLVFLEEFAAAANISTKWVETYYPVFGLRPPSGHSPKDIVGKIKEQLKSGKVKNGKNLKVYLKEKLPSRLHYFNSDRIPPIIGLLDEGYKLEEKNTSTMECGGTHGYDNFYFSMRSIFTAHGPRFAKGRKFQSFENVQIYNLVTTILNIPGAPNNGTASFPKDILLPTL